MKKVILAVMVTLSATTFAQKSNTTNAAMAYNHYVESMQGGDLEQGAKDIWEAKGYIDKSAVHESTQNDAKTLMYKGMIYIDMPMIGEAAGHTEIKALDPKKTMKTGFESLKLANEKDTKGKYEDKINGYCYQKKSIYYNAGIKGFQDKDYEAAMGGFGLSTAYSEVLGMSDSAGYFNTGLAAYNVKEWEVVQESFTKCVEYGYRPGSSVSYLTEAYKSQGKLGEAETMLNEQLAKYPGDKDIMVSLINIYLAQDKKEDAEKVLTNAISVDPNNKDLHYAVATVYENLERYDDAEKAYLKVLELDANYTDALLGLGAVYFNKAADFNGKINDLQPGDPQEEVFRASMNENFKKSLPYLVKADELNPNNKEILTSLKQAYYKLEMMEEYKATKANIDAIK
jgi:tetratricopeptide (TPR) repeat protein